MLRITVAVTPVMVSAVRKRRQTTQPRRILPARNSIEIGPRRKLRTAIPTADGLAVSGMLGEKRTSDEAKQREDSRKDV
jgi:hypothetical protein